MWEIKIPRKIFGPVKENGVWRIRGKQESMELHREPDVITVQLENRRKYGRGEKGGSLGMDTPPQWGLECIWVSGVIKEDDITRLYRPRKNSKRQFGGSHGQTLKERGFIHKHTAVWTVISTDRYRGFGVLLMCENQFVQE
jgi:hypothetical protein